MSNLTYSSAISDASITPINNSDGFKYSNITPTTYDWTQCISKVPDNKAVVVNKAVAIGENNIAKEEESNEMDVRMIECGFLNGNIYGISPKGVAIKDKDNNWVSFDKDKNCIVNVNNCCACGTNLLKKIPVFMEQVNPNDVIIKNDKIVFVMKIKSNSVIVGIDLRSGEKVTLFFPDSTNKFDTLITTIVPTVDLSHLNIK